MACCWEWRPRLLAGQDDDSLRKNAPALFAAELQGNRWGLFSLSLSRWLLARSWTAERNNRGNRQGAAPLGNWLPTLIAEEGAALQLKRYVQQPEDLAEQLPRIERLLVWLHLARGVLEVAEVDRLYGELNKLAELATLQANRAIEPEVLDARKAQLIAIGSLKAWRQLVR
jgi:inorganic triphosphatase YgiF